MIENRDKSSPGFKEIKYTDQKEICYLNDMGDMGPQYVSFLESLNFNQIKQDKQVSSYFDHTIDTLEKRILQGSLDPPSKVSRKNKKGDSDVNYYNSNDIFINDQECCIEKKEKQSTFEDYSCVEVVSIEELYASPIYNRKVEEIIIETGKRKIPEHFTLKEDHQFQKFDEIKKLIGDNILNKNFVPEAEASQKNMNEVPNEPIVPIEEDYDDVQIIVHPPREDK